MSSLLKKEEDTPRPAGLPPAYKKALVAGVACWCVALLSVSALIWVNSKETVSDWEKRSPHGSVPIKTLYLTSQITEAAHSDFSAASSSADAGKRGAISLIFTGIGLTADAYDRVVDDMPPSVAIAFSPYADKLESLVKKAKNAGHEGLLLIPMEPETYPKDDPGPKALLSRLSEKENLTHLGEVLESARDVDGYMNDMGSRFLNNESNVHLVFDVLKKQKKLFIEDQSSGIATPALSLAVKDEISALAAPLKIDDQATDERIREQLFNLEKAAKANGYAIGIASPYPVSFNMIKAWVDTLDKKGIDLVPLAKLSDIKKHAPTIPAATTGEAPHESGQ